MPRALFWNLIAKRYARTPIRDVESYEEKIRLTRERLRPDSRVLELGCGTGTTALRHAPHVARVLGIDFSPRMIEIARERAGAAGVPNVGFEVDDVTRLDFPSGSWDMVMAHSLLHLLDDRADLLRRVHDWLTPGGVLVTNTACLADGPRWLRYAAPVGNALGLFPNVKVVSADAIARDTIDAGFDIAHRWHPHAHTKPGFVAFIVATKLA